MCSMGLCRELFPCRGVGMESDRLIALSARNFADWHEASLNALGIRCKTDAALWRQLGTGGSPVYVSAITLNPLIDPVSQIRQIEQIEALLAGLPHAIIDSWARLDLSGLGHRRSAPQPWYILSPANRRLACTESWDIGRLDIGRLACIHTGFIQERSHSATNALEANSELAEPRVEVVAQPVSQEVQRKDGEADSSAGNNRNPP